MADRSFKVHGRIRRHGAPQQKSSLHEMTDKIITLREPITTSVPTEQSYVADWSNFSRGGTLNADNDDDVISFGSGSETDEQSMVGGGEYQAEAPQDDHRPGFLARIMNPPLPNSSSSAMDDRTQPSSSVRSAPTAERAPPPDYPPAVHAPQTSQIDSTAAAKEIVSAISSVTRSASGDSIADLLDQIATSLRGIEVASRASARPQITQSQPPSSEASLSAAPAAYEDRTRSDRAPDDRSRAMDEMRRGDRDHDSVRAR